MDIRIPLEALREARLYEDGDLETGELLLQGANRTRQEQAIAHGTESNKEYARVSRKGLEEVFSLQP
jgi:hypothetical protein